MDVRLEVDSEYWEEISQKLMEMDGLKTIDPEGKNYRIGSLSLTNEEVEELSDNVWSEHASKLNRKTIGIDIALGDIVEMVLEEARKEEEKD